MKVKYSSKIKLSISRELLSDMVQLSFSIVPHEKFHFFNVHAYSDTLLQVTHSIPRIGYRSIITRQMVKNELFSQDTVILVILNNTIYILMKEELSEEGINQDQDHP